MNEYTCDAANCQTGIMDFEHTVQHLAEKHAIDIYAVQGRRELVMHLDGPKHFYSQYRWTFADSDVALTQFVSQERAEDDPMGLFETDEA